jgi:hypothetical protein
MEGQAMDNAINTPVGEMNIMDSSGHQQLTWREDNPEEVAAAQAAFNRRIRQGFVGFGSAKKLEQKHSLQAFDPTLEEVVMVPRIVGG